MGETIRVVLRPNRLVPEIALGVSNHAAWYWQQFWVSNPYTSLRFLMLQDDNT